MRRRWVVAGAAAVVVAAAGVYVAADTDEPEERFCTAEGLIGPNQEIYGRVGNPECQFEDEDGNLLLTDPRTGEPICYEDEATGDSPRIVGCDEPGARPPG